MAEKVDEVTGEVMQTPDVTDMAPMGVLAKAEIDMQVATAKKYPRNVKHFRARALALATQDEDTAASCFYSIPRAGKRIEGPGVRLAEIVASGWGNLRAKTRVTGVDEKWVYAEAVAWDLETNVAISCETRRRITDKYGKRYKDDMIGVTANAASSIALRNAIFKIVPRAHVDLIYLECREVAIGKQETMVQRRAKLVSYYDKMGIDEERLLAAVKKLSIEQVDKDDLIMLRGMATAIKDGDLDIDEAFPAPAPDMPGDGSKIGFGKKKGTTEEAPAEPKKKTGKKSGKSTKPKEPEKPEESESSEEPEQPESTGGPDLTQEKKRQIDALAEQEAAEKQSGPADPGAAGPDDDPPPQDDDPAAADDENEALF